nr:RHS repeat-associated core domain-containing protein [Micromonospora okii]
MTGGASGTTSYTYDAAGNTTGRNAAQGNQTLTWDDSGKLAEITGGSSGDNSFVYDADGNLLLQKEPGKNTLYLPGQQLTLNTATNVVDGDRYYALPGGGSCVRSGSGTAYTFVVADHQGTPTLYLDNTAQNPTWRQYTPYGGPRGAAVTAPDNRGFLNKPMSPTGLTLVGARAYDPALGRFVSVDPVQDTGQPQQWNGYSYANNTPVTSSDPTGMIPDDCKYFDCYGYNPTTGCPGGCGSTSNVAWGTSNGKSSSKAKPGGKYVPPPRHKPKPKKTECGSFSWICKKASQAKDWVVEHKEDLAGVALGIVVGVGCTALTGGAGAVVCGAIGGALSSGLTGYLKGERGMDLAISFGSGALLGALGGGVGSIVGAGAAGFSAGAAGLRAGLVGGAKKEAGLALQGLAPGAKESLKALAPKNVKSFWEGSRWAIDDEAMRGGIYGQQKQNLAVATDLIVGAASPRNGVIPAAVSGALPGNWNDVQDIVQKGWQFKPENSIGPLLGGGFS